MRNWNRRRICAAGFISRIDPRALRRRILGRGRWPLETTPAADATLVNRPSVSQQADADRIEGPTAVRATEDRSAGPLLAMLPTPTSRYSAIADGQRLADKSRPATEDKNGGNLIAEVPVRPVDDPCPFGRQGVASTRFAKNGALDKTCRRVGNDTVPATGEQDSRDTTAMPVA